MNASTPASTHRIRALVDGAETFRCVGTLSIRSPVRKDVVDRLDPIVSVLFILSANDDLSVRACTVQPEARNPTNLRTITPIMSLAHASEGTRCCRLLRNAYLCPNGQR